MSDDVKLIAFYLPQFHPIPENNDWWGEGFTEWTNVTRAKPLFEGHYQPHLPADLGFYDLRLPETRDQQAKLAHEYGIHGFCYYYYWFSGGKRLLERPLDEMLKSGEPDFPFCLCWANENWSRRWDGSEKQILMEQVHSKESDLDFIRSVVPYLKDDRYIRIAGKPLLLIYRTDIFPNIRDSVALWRDEMQKCGIGEIFLACVESFGERNATDLGFDATVEFPPHTLGSAVPNEIDQVDCYEQCEGGVYDYEKVVDYKLNQDSKSYPYFRGVMPGWDNTARKKSAGHVFINSSPEKYNYWLKGIIDETREKLPKQEQFVFINAWNEWAEGAHLEPDQRYGKRFLEATKAAMQGESLGDNGFLARIQNSGWKEQFEERKRVFANKRFKRKLRRVVLVLLGIALVRLTCDLF